MISLKLSTCDRRRRRPLCLLPRTTANALSGGSHQNFNRLAAHEGISKRNAQNKRSLNKRCKARDGSNSTDIAASTSFSSSWVAPTSTDVPSTDWSSSSDYTPTTSYTPTSTWSSSSSSAAAASPTTAGGTKVGVAWTGSNDQELATVKTSATKFLYNWSSWKNSNSDSLGYEFWAMLHDSSSQSISDFQNNVVAGYCTNVMGFNEPEQQGQANMDPGSAASLWQQYIEPKKDLGMGLISPAVTSDSAGIPWMQSFISACNGGCTFTAGCAAHYYGTDPQDFINYMQTFYNTLQGSCSVIHVTEFACMDFSGATTPDDGQIWNFYSTAIKWMEATPWIGSYFAFGILDDMGNVIQQDALLAGGSVTSLVTPTSTTAGNEQLGASQRKLPLCGRRRSRVHPRIYPRTH
ncbi:glycosyl hydrolase catalytic core-domain-containing protein [Fomitopsis serialis]|uniref:glycosyl hydrolase catalytic core-domain-containing protein n=1 Tax=Fomitopsis serialis TaxID=139415 RepID=UPI002007AAC3|nr:glycosyl hydrolase catalytic core-domain-containing protein [Neoantrodia serialis]KAH9938396.1 glycosyl hydrolase catalytic core-domain-containing protein [Neoantrodia serialis]